MGRTLSYILYLTEEESGRGTTLPDRVAACGDVVEAVVCPQCGQIHSTKIWGCHHRLCPLCSLRESRAAAYQARMALTYMKIKNPEYRYFLLTLTQRNVDGDSLISEIDKVLDAWSSLRFLRAVRGGLRGWARTVEITASGDSFHPHVHVILALAGSGYDELTDEKWWRSAWKKALDIPYEPICDLRPLSDMDAVYEVSKYVTKVTKVLQNDDFAEMYHHVKVISKAIYGRRLRSYGGEWSKYRKLFNMRPTEDMVDYELDKTEDQSCVYTCGSCGNLSENLQTMILVWSGLDYKELK